MPTKRVPTLPALASEDPEPKRPDKPCVRGVGTCPPSEFRRSRTAQWAVRATPGLFERLGMCQPLSQKRLPGHFRLELFREREPFLFRLRQPLLQPGMLGHGVGAGVLVDVEVRVGHEL